MATMEQPRATALPHLDHHPNHHHSHHSHHHRDKNDLDAVTASFANSEMATSLQPLVLPEISPPPSPSFEPSDSTSRDAANPSDREEKDPSSSRQRRRRGSGVSASDDIVFVGVDEKQLCMLCAKRFDMDAERDLFLAHLIMDHNVVIADVKHVPYFPGYVEEWRKMFSKKQLTLDECPKIKTNYVSCPGQMSEEREERDERTTSTSSSAAPSDYAECAADPRNLSTTEKDLGGVDVGVAIGATKSSGGGGILETVDENLPSPPALHQFPEAGDAPAVDAALKNSPRPSPEVEDPAIAAAHPALPAVYARLEDVKEKSASSQHHNQQHPAVSSASLDSILSSSSGSSSFLSITNSTGMMTASHGEDYHFLLCDAIQEDRELRQKLQRKRLEYALQRQESERNDTTFSRQCLFCNAYFEGNRAGLFHHMAEDHNFNVGQPDNIVFSNEFLDTLQSKLDNSICLYCEKDFKDKATLKDHMRKKMHRRIRGSNREYDKFYLINYLELGKSWNDIQSEEDIEIRPGPAAESEWADWTGEGTFSVCLFCSFPSPSAEEIYAHMRAKHGFDLAKIRASLKLSFYQQIKLINFYRRKLHESVCPSCSLAFPDKETTVRHMVETNHTNDVPALVQWDQPQFFFPTYENDHLLSLLEDIDDNPEVAVVQPEDPPDSSIYNSILSQKELRQEILYDCGPQGYKNRAWK